MKTKLLILTVVSALLAVGAQPLVAAHAGAPSKAILTERGTTGVTLDSNLIPTLGSLGVTLSPLAPSTIFVASEGLAYFPIVSGIFDPASTTAEINHSGGLVLSAGGTQLVLSSFVISLSSSGTPILTGLATLNGALVGRIPLFDLGLSTVRISYKMSKLTVEGVNLTLNADAATTLNSIFGTTAFAGGFAIGTAEVESYYNKLPRN